MSDRHRQIDEAQFQALLDGEMPPREAERLRAEIAASPRLSAEFEAWQLLFDDLDDLSHFAPSASFSSRVLDSLPAAGVASVRGRAVVPGAGHLAPEQLQDLIDGRLAARIRAPIESHLESCAVCRTELEAFRRVAVALDELPRLTPSHEFSERVMAGVRVRQMAELAMAPVTGRERLLGWLRSMAPTTGQGWAAAMGVLVTPLTLVALVVRAAFSSELATVSNVLAFAWLKASDVLAGADALLLQQTGLGRVLELVQSTGVGATAVAASGTALLGMTMAAIWVLYRNVLTSPAPGGRHAHLLG